MKGIITIVGCMAASAILTATSIHKQVPPAPAPPVTTTSIEVPVEPVAVKPTEETFAPQPVEVPQDAHASAQDAPSAGVASDCPDGNCSRPAVGKATSTRYRRFRLFGRR